MTDKKLTDNEIKKTCKDCVTFSPCSKKGDYLYRYKCTCSNFVDKNIFEECNRQKTEIERLQAENKLLIEMNISTKYPHCVLCGNGAIFTKSLEEYDKLIADILAEAIKEFAERFSQTAKETTINYVADASIQKRKTGWLEISKADFDNLVKEMVGENND